MLKEILEGKKSFEELATETTDLLKSSMLKVVKTEVSDKGFKIIIEDRINVKVLDLLAKDTKLEVAVEAINKKELAIIFYK